jgi:hypothetical protein
MNRTAKKKYNATIFFKQKSGLSCFLNSPIQIFFIYNFNFSFLLQKLKKKTAN